MNLDRQTPMLLAPEPRHWVPQNDMVHFVIEALMEQAQRSDQAEDADGSQLILSNHVSTCASDAIELETAVEDVPPSVGQVSAALADSGYVNKVRGEWDLVCLAYKVKRLGGLRTA